MTREVIRHFLSCVLLLPIFITGTAAAQEKIKAGISSFSASYISMFIANKRGYYAEEGMSVDIILIAGLLGTRALIGGSVEFGSASNPTAAVQGAKLKMLMVFNEKPHSALFAQPGIKSVAELRGKRIGGSTVGSLEYGWIKELLPKFGLQLDRDVTFLPIGPTATRFTALKTATVDATLLGPPSSFLAQDAGFPVLTRVSDHVEDIQACIVTTDERLTRQSEMVRRFLRATVKGQRVYLARREEAIPALMEFARLPNREMAGRLYDENMKTIAKDGTITERLQQIVIERSKRLTGINRDIRPDEIFDFSHLRHVQAELTQSGWTP
jgi:NitT/TauT family transport system substrate-binding protein